MISLLRPRPKGGHSCAGQLSAGRLSARRGAARLAHLYRPWVWHLLGAGPVGSLFVFMTVLPRVALPARTMVLSSKRFCAAGDSWQYLELVLIGGGSGLCWPLVGRGQDAATHPTIPKTVCSPHEELLGPKCQQCKGKKPCFRTLVCDHGDPCVLPAL